MFKFLRQSALLVLISTLSATNVSANDVTATVTSGSPPPTPTESTYYYIACNNTAGTFTINFSPGTAATSSNWSLPDNTWRVNGGQGVIYSYSHNVGAATSVTISVPANVAVGTYEIHTSSNGPAGTAGYRSIPVVVVSGVPRGQIDGARYTVPNSRYGYSLMSSGATNFNWTVTGDYTLDSGQGTEAIYVTSSSSDEDVSIGVSYVDACGHTNSTTILVRNSASRARRVYEEKAVQNPIATPAPALYPNPATDEVSISAGGKKAQVTIYDIYGRAHKSLSLGEGVLKMNVDVHDLPAGVYSVRIVSPNQETIHHHLQIQH